MGIPHFGIEREKTKKWYTNKYLKQFYLYNIYIDDYNFLQPSNRCIILSLLISYRILKFSTVFLSVNSDKHIASLLSYYLQSHLCIHYTLYILYNNILIIVYHNEK